MATPDQRLVSAFDECISRLVRGEPLESVLARFPDLAGTLRPMLEAGALVRRAQPDPREVLAAQERVRFYVQRHIRKPTRGRFAAHALMSAAALLLIVFVGMLFLAERSLPGDALYGLKRASESVRAALGGADFAERRIDETLALMAARRPAEVVFQGHVAAMGDPLWVVEGVPLWVDSATTITSGVGVGDRVEVQARISEEGLALALEISLLEKGVSPTSTPALVATPTLTTTPTATPTPTATSSPTATASPTLTATATPSPTATPTWAPSRTATARPVILPPPGGENDNDDENDNENENDDDDHSGRGNGGGNDDNDNDDDNGDNDD